jgi:hypothetical protein
MKQIAESSRHREGMERFYSLKCGAGDWKITIVSSLQVASEANRSVLRNELR